MLKNLQARLQQYMNHELPDVQAEFRKGRGTRDQIANICWIIVEKAMATHSSTLAWKIPWTEEPGRLQSMGSRRVGHDWATLLSLFTFIHWRRKWQPLQYFCLENPRDEGDWWAAVYGVEQSQTQLKQFSNSSSIKCFSGTLAFSMIQRMLAIWSLVHLPFLKPAWTSGCSRLTDCWSLAWSIPLLACEMSAIVQ